jgi:hypothetical protein
MLLIWKTAKEHKGMYQFIAGMGKFIIQFIDHNGMRPIMALTVISGAIWITINSDKICVIREPQSGNQPQVIRDNPVCSKYFEMTALVLGGLIGLAQPGISKQDKPSDRQEQPSEKNTET